MSTMDSTSESVHTDPEDIEIKIEYPDPDEDLETGNYSTFEDTRKMQNQGPVQMQTSNLWTSKATSCLISQYKKYRSMVGQTTQFRSLRDMFETISVEMQKRGFYFSPQKCENKWRVLERKYKNLVIREMMKKPGRMKHYGHWEHKRALDEIFNEKRKSVYLKESEFPPVGNSTKYALILPKPVAEQNNGQVVSETIQKLRTSIEKVATAPVGETVTLTVPGKLTTTHTNGQELSKDSTAAYFDKFIAEMKMLFETAERNKHRRHLEMMAVQQRLLKLKEEKLELEKKKILAMAQSIQLNM